MYRGGELRVPVQVRVRGSVSVLVGVGVGVRVSDPLSRYWSLSSFDTHPRCQFVMQSARFRRSYGKIEECEQSTENALNCQGS